MKKVIALTVLSVFVMCAAFYSVAAACTGYSNFVDAQRYSYPGDGDDAYATTNGTWCGSSWDNYLYVKLDIHYKGSPGINTYTKAGTDKSSVSVDGTCPSNTGTYAEGTHTNWCYHCSPYPQHLCDNVITRDYY